MKKYSVLICILLLITIFAACSKVDNIDSVTTSTIATESVSTTIETTIKSTEKANLQKLKLQLPKRQKLRLPKEALLQLLKSPPKVQSHHQAEIIVNHQEVVHLQTIIQAEIQIIAHHHLQQVIIVMRVEHIIVSMLV